MLTLAELLRAVLLPALVAAALALIARWRRWDWAIPIAIAAGFAAGCLVYRGIPSLPPRDGTDWLLWIAVPYGIVAAGLIWRGPRWDGWKPLVALGVTALGVGLCALVVALPLSHAGTVSTRRLLVASLAFLVGAAVLMVVARVAAARVGVVTLLCVMALAAGATGVVIFSSNLRVVGVYGMSAAAAMAGTATAMIGAGLRVSTFACTVTALFAAALIAGLLSGGHYYPDPGVFWEHVTMLFASPLLVLAGALLPTRRRWVRSVVGVLAVGLAVAAVAAPIAIKAKKAAEEDPYGSYR